LPRKKTQADKGKTTDAPVVQAVPEAQPQAEIAQPPTTPIVPAVPERATISEQKALVLTEIRAMGIEPMVYFVKGTDTGQPTNADYAKATSRFLVLTGIGNRSRIIGERVMSIWEQNFPEEGYVTKRKGQRWVKTFSLEVAVKTLAVLGGGF